MTGHSSADEDPYAHTEDAQARAYRDAGDDDHWSDDLDALITEHGAVHHGPITSAEDVLDCINLPHDYEVAQWDLGREGPKSVAEAQDVLAARIADPHAPDGEETRGAYDDLGDD